MKSCPECGTVFEKRRSLPDHRRFFGVLSAAFANWPETYHFQPSSAEHLRAFLLVECGYADATPVFSDVDGLPEETRPHALKLVSLTVEAAIAAALSERSYAFARIVGDTVTVFRPKSINFQTLSQREFGPIRTAVEEVIESVIGIPADKLLKEFEAAA